MAQSSNYKQYNRTTRILTEESGFAGGMLWTENNIDETRLKAIVNFDYDETTGHLKSRDPFKSTELGLKEWSAAQSVLDINLLDKTLIGVYNICATQTDTVSETLTDAGHLYVFATLSQQGTVCEIENLKDSATLIYINTAGEISKCVLDVLNCSIRNGKRNQLFTLYDNQLYSYGTYIDADGNVVDEAFIQTYRLELKEDVYTFKQLDYAKYVKPRIDSVTLLEAGVSGFNAARGALTYTYDAERLTDSTEQPKILGLFLLDESGKPVVSPRIGQKCTIKIATSYFYNTTESATDKRQIVCLFQLKDNSGSESTQAGDIWKLVDSSEVSVSEGMHTFDFVFQKKETTFAIAYYGSITPKSKYEVYSDDVKDLLAPYVITANKNLDNVKLKTYNLAVADNHCLWNNRMCIWGTEDNNNCLFLSEIDNFYYYPVPNNVAVFNTNVISCIPYKDSLLVFTADKIHRLVEDVNGTFTQTVVQNDMPMTKDDAAYLTAIKNMVLFKSGNYFYMVVPKSQSLTDELSIAPIYKNIAGFLNNLDKSAAEVLKLLYPDRRFNECSVLHSAPTSIYAEQDTVHILYDVMTNTTYSAATIDVTSSGELEENVAMITAVNMFKLFLNYNTNLRAWTLYIEETTDVSLEPATLTASRLMSFVRVYNDNTLDVVTQQYSEDVADSLRALLDTGYRTLSTAVQKRFREVQLKLHNATENLTSFGTSFLVDGMWRRSYSKLEEFTSVDNTVTLNPVFDVNTFITELSMPIQEDGSVIKAPGSDSIELSDWRLDFSHFKREAPVTVRVPVSGKGYNPRFIFMAPNAIALTVNEINWVYRLMHGR